MGGSFQRMCWTECPLRTSRVWSLTRPVSFIGCRSVLGVVPGSAIAMERRAAEPPSSGFEIALVAAGGFVLGSAGIVWGGAWLAARVAGGELNAGLGDALQAAGRLVTEPGKPAQAWGDLATALPTPALYWACTIAVAVAIAACVRACGGCGGAGRRRRSHGSECRSTPGRPGRRMSGRLWFPRRCRRPDGCCSAGWHHVGRSSRPRIGNAIPPVAGAGWHAKATAVRWR